ncbi:hypothetical protein P0W64_19090 [Tsukamurella sp. 8F]|uniref:hypothetical protein n=1 Tax=unclassified Tsukamurella TaxID=2633480 RepID=UPI0023B8AFEE|nr:MULTISPECIES: hypothetical protein [unclassified Tsukamurella]MDF0531992.1 hypothetical protein [Tsukamurella sp. 8J]MDF0588891.1 hypothetical protein [Tsukamurella sp. 8F]
MATDVDAAHLAAAPAQGPFTALTRRLLAAVMLLPIYAMTLYTLWMPAHEKFFESERVLGMYVRIFDGSILDRLGLTVPMIYAIGVLELITVALLVASLARREFLPGRTAPLLLVGLWLATVLYAMLGFGMRLVQNYPGLSSQYIYMIATLGFLAFTLIWKKRGTNPLT